MKVSQLIYNVDAKNCTEALIKYNSKLIHTDIVNNHMQNKRLNKTTGQPAQGISKEESILFRETRQTLAQLRTNKPPMPFS